MSEEDREQEQVHAALVEALTVVPENAVVTGWIVVFEYATSDGKLCCGHAYGPTGMTTWRSLGLLEWAGRVTIPSTIDVMNDEEEE